MRESEQTSLGYSKHRLPLTHAQDDLGETMSHVWILSISRMRPTLRNGYVDMLACLCAVGL